MSLGIGGGGLMGIAFELLSPPVLSGNAVAGGALTAGTYRYYATAINANGETSVSNEVTVTTSAGNLTAALTWPAVTGATGYKIYRTAAGGGTGTELLVTTLGAVTSYNDTAVGAPSGAFPTANTASNPGVYAAPQKYLPFNNESIQMKQDTVWRRPIRQSVGVLGAVPGNSHPEGDVEMECLEDVLVWFMYASRMQVTKTGGGPNYTYTGVPTPNAIPARTLSVTVQRNDVGVFGYVGMVVSSFKFSLTNGDLMYNITLMGRDEASQSVPTPTWPTSTPFGAGMYTIEVPTGTPVLDTDNFEVNVDDNGVANFRLKNTGRNADFINYGERTCTTTLERDFITRTDYDAFKAYTGQAIHILASKGTNNLVDIVLNTAIKDTYEVSLGAQGDLVRAKVTYQNIVNASGQEYTLTVKTQENIS